MTYPRELQKKINLFLKRREIIAIKGPRQSGKTTLIKNLYAELSTRQKCLYLTFEKKDNLELFEKDIENFKKLYCQKYKIIFIDEFQYAKNGGQKLKYLFDATNCKFIITGSSSLELTSQTGRFLVGRLFSFNLYPFSFAEFLAVKEKILLPIIKPAADFLNKIITHSKTALIKEPIKSMGLKDKLFKLLDEYIVFGGYPAVCLTEKLAEKEQILRGILETYLLRDIKNLLDLATDEELIDIAKFLSLQIGNLVVYKELSNISKISFQNLKRHLNILKETYILNLVLPYCRNKRIELAKNPKVYFLDTGFRNMLINNFSSLSARPDKGPLFENYVFCQLQRKVEFLGGIKFWRTKSQAEIDFVLEQGGNLLPVEVKYSLKQPILGKSFYSFIKKYQPAKGLVITADFWGQKIVDKTLIFFIPAIYL